MDNELVRRCNIWPEVPEFWEECTTDEARLKQRLRCGAEQLDRYYGVPLEYTERLIKWTFADLTRNFKFTAKETVEGAAI